MGPGSKTIPELVDRTGSRGSHAVLGLWVGIDGLHWLCLHLLEGGMGSSSRPRPSDSRVGLARRYGREEPMGIQPRCEDCWQGEKILEGDWRGVAGRLRGPCLSRASESWSQAESRLEAGRGRASLSLRQSGPARTRLREGRGRGPRNLERPWLALIKDAEMEAEGALGPTNSEGNFPRFAGL